MGRTVAIVAQYQKVVLVVKASHGSGLPPATDWDFVMNLKAMTPNFFASFTRITRPFNRCLRRRRPKMILGKESGA